MPNLQHIRKRIQAVKNTEQITKAMKMVAAAKFRKAQEAVLRARPFAREMHSTLGRLARHHEEVGEHPLMVAREPAESEDLFVLTSDRGLCGSFNSNVHRKVEHYLLDHQDRRDRIFLSTIGGIHQHNIEFITLSVLADIPLQRVTMEDLWTINIMQ